MKELHKECAEKLRQGELYLLTGWISDEMKPYHWSESVDRVIIKNIGVKLNFISNDNTFVCESGEELVVEREDYFNDVRLK